MQLHVRHPIAGSVLIAVGLIAGIRLFLWYRNDEIAFIDPTFRLIFYGVFILAALSFVGGILLLRNPKGRAN